MIRSWVLAGTGSLCLLAVAGSAAADPGPALIDQRFPRLLQRLTIQHPGDSGVYILDKGEEALLARAWMVTQAERSFDILTFIWSFDTIGLIATDAMLKAAERGVLVRVLVDDIHLDSEYFDLLLALDAHPLLEIRVFNPVVRVGVSKLRMVANLLTDFRRFNLRLHNKTIIADGMAGICGGRNVADEYFDYNQEYNFRDRDILVIGPMVEQMQANFDRFWTSELAQMIGELLPQRRAALTDDDIRKIYRDLDHCARRLIDSLPLVQRALAEGEERLHELLEELVWTSDLWFVSDSPEKNLEKSGLGGGGEMADALRQAIASARRKITIQSPYLILPEDGFGLFAKLEEGVAVQISTNSLASTDNVATFSGYMKMRQRLLAAGIEIREFKPNPAIESELIEQYHDPDRPHPIFVMHAKTLVIDGELLYVGTFNLDPRSANLSTEEGVFVRNRLLARQLEEQIELEMQEENSWDPRLTNPNPQTSWWRRLQAGFLRLLPIRPLL
ncbi:MAG: phospholipase D family protein [Desulfuromonadales bacterium]|nr:phospholipase D family protein [Desulfuromonadales bacterium]